MKFKIILCFCTTLLLSALLFSCNKGDKQSSGSRKITDMAGRTVELPETVSKIFGVNPNASILIYTFNYDLLAAWNYRLPADTEEFFPESVYSLASYGQLFGSNASASYEEVLTLDTDIILCYWPVSPGLIKKMDELEDRLNIPVVILDSSFDRLIDSYALLGIITGNTERGEYLGAASSAIVNRVKTMQDSGPSSLSFYYGSGSDGLSTISQNSVYMKIFKLCNMESIGAVKSETKWQRSNISIEELIAANPYYIFINDNDKRENSAELLTKDPRWKLLDAVENKRLYPVPNKPFNWIDKPASVNRLSGLLYLSYIVNSGYDDEKFFTDIKSYFHDFYHLEVALSFEKNMVRIVPVSFVK